MRTRVICGGQTGVDQAALRAARGMGIQTGGTAAKGWFTEDGPATWLAAYGLLECKRTGYPPRTRANVEGSHATLILTDRLPLKGGTLLTYDIGIEVGSRHDGIGLYVADLPHAAGHLSPVREWLAECMAQNPKWAGESAFVLNVAGPRESVSHGIGERAEAFLRDALTVLVAV